MKQTNQKKKMHVVLFFVELVLFICSLARHSLNMAVRQVYMFTINMFRDYFLQLRPAVEFRAPSQVEDLTFKTIYSSKRLIKCYV